RLAGLPSTTARGRKRRTPPAPEAGRGGRRGRRRGPSVTARRDLPHSFARGRREGRTGPRRAAPGSLRAGRRPLPRRALGALLEEAHVLVHRGAEAEGARVDQVLAGGRELGALVEGDGPGRRPDAGVGLADQGAALAVVERGDGLVEELVDLVGADPGVVLLHVQRAVGGRDGLGVDGAGVGGGVGGRGPGVQGEVVLAGRDVVLEEAVVLDLGDVRADADPGEHLGDPVRHGAQDVGAGPGGEHEAQGERLAVLGEGGGLRPGRGGRALGGVRAGGGALLHLLVLGAVLGQVVVAVPRARPAGRLAVVPAVLLLPVLLLVLLLAVLLLAVLVLILLLVLLLVLADDTGIVVVLGVLAGALGLLPLGAGRLLLVPLLLLHRAARHPPGVREERPRLLGVLVAEGAAVVGVGGLAGQGEVTADGFGGQAERLEDRLGQGPAVQGTGHGPADPLVGEGALGAVEGELGVGGLQGRADLEGAEGLLLPRPDRRLLAGGGLLLGGLLVRAVGDGPGVQCLGGGGGAAAGAHQGGGPVPRRGADGDAAGGGGVDLRQVDVPGGERGDPFVEGHRAQHDLLEPGRVTPPPRVAGQGDLVLLAVDLLDLEGAGGDLQLLAGAVVGGVGRDHDLLGVQRREQRPPVRVGAAEGDLDLEVPLAALDLLDAVVAGVAGGPVGGVLAGQGAPLGGEVGGADLAAVAPHGLLVELVEHDLLGLGLDDLGGLQVVGVAFRPSARVHAEHRRQDGL